MGHSYRLRHENAADTETNQGDVKAKTTSKPASTTSNDLAGLGAATAKASTNFPGKPKTSGKDSK